MSVNKVILIGRLGQDPTTRCMPNGESVTNATLATSENWKDKSGEKQEKTEWHNLTFYRRLAEIAGEYLKKGSMIYVEGKITTNKWQDKEGKDRYTTSIIVNEMQMLSGKADQSTRDESPSTAPPAEKKQFDPNNFDATSPFVDDVPF